MQIRIVKRPAGEAPEEVRDVWIGVVVPCLRRISAKEAKHGSRGVVSGRTDPAAGDKYEVPIGGALRALRESGKAGARACEWWTTMSGHFTDCLRTADHAVAVFLIAQDHASSLDAVFFVGSPPTFLFNVSECEEVS